MVAYLRKNQVSADQRTATITAVYETLARLGKHPNPPLPRRQPFQFGAACGPSIVCLECSWSGKTIRRHLGTAHGMTPNEYRTHWGLPSDYPLVAPNYAAQRSEFAKSIGLGRKRGNAAGLASQQEGEPSP